MPRTRRPSRAPLNLLLLLLAACTPALPKADTESKPESGRLQPLQSSAATDELTLAAASPRAAGGGRAGDTATPGASDASRGRMGYWRFNTPDLRGERGQTPLIATNLQLTQSFDGTAVKWIATNGPALLKYRVVEPDGTSNLDCRRGTIRFLYRANWASPNAGGKGPGAWIRLFEVGSPTPNASIGWFALSIDPTGTNLWFTAQDNAGHSFSNVCNTGLANASVGITFRSNSWTELTISYSDNRLQIWQSGARFTDRTISPLPTPPSSVLALGFSIGSSIDGTFPAQGSIDEFEFLNYPMGRSEGEYPLTRDFGVTVETNPPAIRAQWRRDPAYRTILSRRSWGQTNWTALATNAGWQYTDTNIMPGQRYEYTLALVGVTELTAYATAGVNLPPVEDRGRIILLVDETIARPLAADLARLALDLVGDGWTVIRRDVPRHDDKRWQNNTNGIARIKADIIADYRAEPQRTRAIYIIGHAVIPYSGFINPDGHHQRPWPSDIYYGDIDGIWTDTNNVTGKVAGDGIFDQDSATSLLELAVGRVDFARLPGFAAAKTPHSKRELDLIKQYLAKTHRYRHREIILPDRAAVMGSFKSTEDNFVYGNAPVNAYRWFGLKPGVLVDADPFRDRGAFLWAFVGGFGSGVSINSLPGFGVERRGMDLADPAIEPAVGFYTLHGSYFCEWNIDDNFMRSVLATPNYGYAAVWNRGNSLLFERLGVGETLGEGFLRMQNEGWVKPQLTLGLLGDPSLRLRTAAPPLNPKAETRSGDVVLTWKSPAAGAAGFFVYRSTSALAGPFKRLGTVPGGESRFTDTNAPAGNKLYQIRSASLEVTGSGSYTNLSQAAFISAK